MNVPIYHGIFFNKDAINAIKKHIGIEAPSLPNVIKHPHITFGFRVKPIEGFDKLCIDYPTSDGLTLVVGYGNDSGNEGFLVQINHEIADFYQGQIAGRDEKGNIYAHITISYDKTQGRKPVDTGSIDYETFDNISIPISGHFGYFDGHVHYYENEI